MYGELDPPKKPRRLEDFMFSNNISIPGSNCYLPPVYAINAIPGSNLEIVEPKKETWEQEKNRLIREHIEDSKKWMRRFNDESKGWSQELMHMEKCATLFFAVAAFELMAIIYMVCAHLL